MNDRTHTPIPILLLILALILLSHGALTGDAAAVFMKASTICMECIGLG